MSSHHKKFSYDLAFSRNLGWVTEEEQSILKEARVGIAGLGGVGGNYLLTLCRLGVEKFVIADFDRFELQNFNRQVGATLPNIGRVKTEAILEMARDINPNIQVSVFSEGINETNLVDFISPLDLYIDGLDFYCLGIRELVFRECHRRNIHAFTVAPVGMGAALVHFPPGAMSFDNYFGLHSVESEQDKALMFLMGLTPSGIHQKSLVEPWRIDLEQKKAPSTFMGCQLCAGIAATEALKVLLKRGPISPAPFSLHFDAYSYSYRKVKLRGGYKNMWQRLKFKIARRNLG